MFIHIDIQWGKHTLASRRMTNTAGHDHKVNKTNVMPVVLVRDPYSWMQSMVSVISVFMVFKNCCLELISVI